MTTILLIGLFVGMHHALEADHVAAVASMAADEISPRRIVAHGSVWGLGHMVTLAVFAGGAVLFGAAIGPDLARWLEMAVGVMLVALGGHLLVRLWRDRIHFHRHRHADGTVHLHAHSHRNEAVEHDRSRHDHRHHRGLPVRTFVVGMMHGMAGSAALLVLSATAFAEPALALAYVALFGLGSVAGMAVLSAMMALPLAYTARALTVGHRALRGAIGVGTVAVGLMIVARMAAA